MSGIGIVYATIIQQATLYQATIYGVSIGRLALEDGSLILLEDESFLLIE